MSRIVYAFVAAATFSSALALPAAADGRDDYERNAWRQTVVAAAPAATLVEGRNAAVVNVAPQSVEPYIARQMDKDRRGRGR